jgi:hypothetical protein
MVLVAWLGGRGEAQLPGNVIDGYLFFHARGVNGLPPGGKTEDRKFCNRLQNSKNQGILNPLKAENLIDPIGLQDPAFSTRFATAAALKATLDQYQATDLPIYVTELDIDGQTDQIQLDEYKRVFPVYWEHRRIGFKSDPIETETGEAQPQGERVPLCAPCG